MDEEGDDKRDESASNSNWEEGDEEGTAAAAPATASMASSGVMGASGCVSTPSCSHHLSETVTSVRRMMDDIVVQLSLQTEEMKSLKKEIARRIDTEKDLTDGENAKAQPKEMEPLAHAEEGKKFIYPKSFLPAHCTAPVFLPTGGTSPSRAPAKPSQAVTPSAPSPTPSMTEHLAALPEPLQPETTLTAHRAAVLKQFHDGTNTLRTMDGVQQPPPLASKQPLPTPQQESDDEDYHSTGDNGEQTPAHRVSG